MILKTGTTQADRISLSKNIFRAISATSDVPPLGHFPRSDQVGCFVLDGWNDRMTKPHIGNIQVLYWPNRLPQRGIRTGTYAPCDCSNALAHTPIQAEKEMEFAFNNCHKGAHRNQEYNALSSGSRYFTWLIHVLPQTDAHLPHSHETYPWSTPF